MLTSRRADRAQGDTLAPGATLGLLTSMFAMAALPFAVTGTNLAIPEMRTGLNTSLSVLSWALSGYSIVLAGFTLMGGTAARRLGTHRAFAVGTAVFTLGSVLCMAAPTAALLIVGRVVQALGGALVVPASVSVALVGWPASRRAFAMAVWTASFPIGSSLAPVVSALLLDLGSWRTVFAVPAALSGLALLLGWFLPRQSREGTGSAVELPDLLGMVMGTLAAGLLALGIVEGRPWGWTDWKVLSAIGVAVVLIPLFVIRSQRHPRPFLPVKFFRIPTFRSANIANVFVSMSGMSVWLIWPLLMKGMWHYSDLRVGLAMTPTPVLGGGLSVLSSRWTKTHGFRGMLIVGALVLTAANVFFVLSVSAEPNYWGTMFPGLVLTGTGMGLLFAPLNAAALIDLPAEEFATGNATFSTGRFLAGAIGIAGVVAMLSGTGGGDPTDPFARAYLLLAVVAVLSLVTLAVSYPKTRNGNE